MLCIYSIPVSNDNSVISAQADIVDGLLPFRIPWTFMSDAMEDKNRSNNILDYLTLSDTAQCEISQCYFTSKSPEILEWSKLYMNNKDTNMMLKNIQKSKNVKWTAAQLKLISPGYNTALV